MIMKTENYLAPDFLVEELSAESGFALSGGGCKQRIL